MNNSSPVLYIMMNHEISSVNISNGLTFGSARGQKVVIPIQDEAIKLSAGRLQIEQDSCYVTCIDGKLRVDDVILNNGQSVKLFQNSRIRLCNNLGEIYQTAALVYWKPENEIIPRLRKVDKKKCTFFGVSSMMDGDICVVGKQLVFCLGKEVIYQEKINAVDEINDWKLKNAREKESFDGLQINIHSVEVGFPLRKTTILKDIHLTLKPGNMYLLFGKSPAEKTIFMKAVTGMIESDAEVTFGNMDLLHDQQTHSYIGFAPKFSEEHFRNNDTVYHTLDDALQLLAFSQYADSKSLRKEKISEVLHMLDMEKMADNRCKTLSRSQKKRLSIALEYVTEPAIMFLDEPDFGVIGTEVGELMSKLKSIADLGKIVCITSYSPDRLQELFDGIIVIGKSSEGCGRLCYFGPVDQALDFFRCETFHDLDIKISSPGSEARVDQYIKRYSAMH